MMAKMFGARRVVVIVLLLLPLLAPTVMPSSRQLSLLASAATLAMLCYALNLAFGYAGLVSAAHGALWGAGAYAAGYATTHWGWGFWMTLPIAALAAVAFAGIIGIPALRSVGTYFMLITFGAGEFMRLAEMNLKDITGGINGLVTTATPPPIGPIRFGLNNLLENYFLALAFMYATILIVWLIRSSNFGGRMIAIRDNEPLALSVGINTFRVKLIVFLISGAIAGVAGNLYLYQKFAISPDLFGSFAGMQLFSTLIVGGLGTLAGPALGAFFLTFLPELLKLDPEQSRAAYGALLIFFILLLPKGLAGSLGKLRWRSWTSWSRRSSQREAEMGDRNIVATRESEPAEVQ